MSRPLVDVRLEGVSTATGPRPHLDAVSLHVRYGELFSVLGPPQSGKSTILRAVAGFAPLSGGHVLIDGHDVAAVPPGTRGIGYVPKEGALWPHMSVAQHVAFGLREQGMAAEELAAKVDRVLTRLGLADVRERKPDELNLEGRRRLALARALAVEPRVLLLDEPLVHLDPIARKTLRIELAKLHADLAVTTICATRDAADALALSDRLAVVLGGRVIQVGDAETLYRRPQSRAVAEALGPANFLPVRVVEVRELGVVVETDNGDRVPVAGIGEFTTGSRGLLVLRPEIMTIHDAAMGRGPGLPGKIVLRVFEGARHVYEVDIGVAAPVRVEVPASAESPLFRLGDRVRVEMSSDTVVLISDESRR